MKPGETISRSPLDKSLGQLTEDDISQITREDCRRYLKEKGMRRPSWNKSQAIEQVISLKALLETRTDSDTSDELREKIHVSLPENPSHVPTSSDKITSAGFQVSVSTYESLSYRRKDPPMPVFFDDVSCRLHVSDSNNTSPRNMGTMNGLVSQMTIFYCGKVNVYDGMPAEKARTIMKLAANPNYPPQDTPGGNAAVRPIPCRLEAASIIPGLTPATVSPNMQNVVADNSQQCKEGAVSHEVEYEGPTSRKESLQRYLEKRKDRGKFKNKRKIGVSTSSGLEMYLNHQMRGLDPNEQSSRSSTCSPPQPRPPHTPTRCSSAENQDKNIGLSVDLTNNGISDVQEA